MKTPTICPLCNKKMMYSSGDCMWWNTFSCGNKKHKNLHLTCEANEVAFIELYEVDTKIVIHWALREAGDTPANMLTIGADFVRNKNQKVDWNFKSPLMDKFKEIIKKLEIRETFL
jgi:hypothetical protein